MNDGVLSRRDLLEAGAIAGAGALAAGVPEAEAARRRRRRRPVRRVADVVVIGAGFAGLTAARELVKDDRAVFVLEARNRVGGRVLNKPVGGGEESEAGGTFAGLLDVEVRETGLPELIPGLDRDPPRLARVSLSRKRRPGRGSVAFRTRGLRAGHFRVVVRAQDASRNRSRRVVRRFRVVP